MLGAEGQEGDGHRHADEGAEDTPEIGPYEHRKHDDDRRYRERAAGDARLDIAADHNWIRLRQAKTAITDCQESNCVMANSVAKTVATSGPETGCGSARR